MTDAEVIAKAKSWTDNFYGLPPSVAKDLVEVADRACRERDEAREALEPLAEMEGSIAPDLRDDLEIEITVTIGQVRRARAALAAWREKP